MNDKTKLRKLEHIEIVLKEKVEPKQTTLLEEVSLIHNSAPNLDYKEIDTSIEFLGKRITAPILITGMTGGHPEAAKINEALAEVAEEIGIPIGVGSQRAAIEDPDLEYTFSIVREKAPSVPVIANIGAAQLVKGYGVKELIKAISMVKADAIAIHLNPAQEVFQPEGDKDFKNTIDIIASLIDELPVPIIIKETGTGLSGKVARAFAEIGVEYFDIAGLGGTNWVLVESYRLKNEQLKQIAQEFSEWGIPTSISIIDVFYNVPNAIIIASGGIRSGLDIAKAIALGADIVGIAAPALKKLLIHGKEGLKNYILRLVNELKIALFLTSSNKPQDLWEKDIILGLSILKWLKSLDIELNEYLKLRKLKKTLNNTTL